MMVYWDNSITIETSVGFESTLEFYSVYVDKLLLNATSMSVVEHKTWGELRLIGITQLFRCPVHTF